MSDGTGRGTGTGTDQEMNMNAAEAAAIITEADARARPVLRPDHRVTFLVWGVIWFIGDGLMWLAVRGQHPYHRPRAPVNENQQPSDARADRGFR